MGWFRSDEMTLISLIMNQDAAHACVHNLGKLGTVQFLDLNAERPAFQRRFVSFVRRCDELERKMRYFADTLKEMAVEPQPAEPVEQFLDALESTQAVELRSSTKVLEELEATLADRENQLIQLTGFYKKLEAAFNVQRERDEVLRRTFQFYSEHGEGSDGGGGSGGGLGAMSLTSGGSGGGTAEAGGGASDTSGAFQGEASGLIMRFTTLVGVLCAADVPRFERMIFRVTRGNCFLRLEPIETPLVDAETGAVVAKSAFTAYFKSEVVGRKVRRVCEAFRATLFELESTNPGDIRAAMEANSGEMLESESVLVKNRAAVVSLCSDIGWRYASWARTIRHEKLIYHTLNCLGEEVSGMLSAEAWVVTSALPEVRAAVKAAHSSEEGGSGGLPFTVAEKPRPWPVPPTRFVVNKFTACFQETVDTYGVARYREANPALFTAITFPFLFGVMYGDIGHGTCLLLMGIFLVATESRAAKQKGELMVGLYFGRYMILLMGFFAVYCGLLYNDFFSLGLDVFGSKWELPKEDDARCTAQKDSTGRSECSMFPVGMAAADGNAIATGGDVYAFGVDPAWHGTSNELLFYNSLKMKLSVTLGVAQMLVGILLKGWNALHFEQRLDFLWEFIPQLVFACSIFGYLIIMIFVKWSIDWDVRMGMNKGDAAGCTLQYGGSGQGCQPPSIIAALIDMVLKPGVVADPMYAGQAAMQGTLLTAAMISVPAMLLVKVCGPGGAEPVGACVSACPLSIAPSRSNLLFPISRNTAPMHFGPRRTPAAAAPQAPER